MVSTRRASQSLYYETMLRQVAQDPDSIEEQSWGTGGANLGLDWTVAPACLPACLPALLPTFIHSLLNRCRPPIPPKRWRYRGQEGGRKPQVGTLGGQILCTTLGGST